MLTNMDERKITNGDIDLMIAEIEEGWRELSMISRSCRAIREDLVRLTQVLDEIIY